MARHAKKGIFLKCILDINMKSGNLLGWICSHRAVGAETQLMCGQRKPELFWNNK